MELYLIVKDVRNFFFFLILQQGNLPSGNLAIDVLTEKDLVDLKLIAKLNPEFIAASFGK